MISDLSAVRRLIESHGDAAVVVALFNTGKFGFDPSILQGLIGDYEMVELEVRADDWFIVRFPLRR